jgi:bacteriocin biosynthesis cyclodehydratase domain-containing protein
MATDTSPRLRFLPFQSIHDSRGLVLKRGIDQVVLEGGEAAGVLQTLSSALGNGGATAEEAASLFAEPDRPRIMELLSYLARRRFVAPVNGSPADEAETGLDVLYWQFGRSRQGVAHALADVRVAFVGVNRLTAQMAAALCDVGFGPVQVVDDPLLRSEGFFDDGAWPDALPAPAEAEAWKRGLAPGAATCLVATSDFGGQALLLPWNRFAVEHGMHFLSVTLQDLIGYVGPFVVPGESACLECLRGRQNANLANPAERRLAEPHAHEGQRMAASHPAMLAVTAQVAAFELHRFYAGLPQWKVGQLVEVNLTASAVAARKVLKAPRCPVCSPLHDGIPTNVRKMVPLTALMNR